MRADMCELQVRVHGRPVREYQHQGHHYIEGRKGSDFVLRVRNLTGARVLAVLSIDGLSVIKGEPASVKGGGYVLGPWQQIDIPGWSLNNSEVARFTFHKDSQSYAALTGNKPQHIGLIGCAVFREKVAETTWTIMPSVNQSGTGGITRSGMDSGFKNIPVSTYNCSMNQVRSVGDPNVRHAMPKQEHEGQAVSSEIGTGFGKRQDFKVNETHFVRENEHPNELLEVTYDTRKGLEKRGVDLNQKPTVATPEPSPTPWPGDQKCQPPEGWRG